MRGSISTGFALLRCCIFLSALSNVAFSQLAGKHFESISVANGLSSNIAHDVMQDRDGFFWIATLNGLNRFDGTFFKVFQFNRNDSTSLSHNLCSKLVEGNDGDIWVATNGGVCRYRKKEGKFTRYFFKHPDFSYDILNGVYTITKDEQGNIWAASYGLWKIDPVTNKVEGWLHDKSKSTSISDSTRSWILFYDQHRKGIWVKTMEGLNFFDLANNTFYHSNNNPHRWPIFRYVTKYPLVCGDSQSTIWVYNDSTKTLHSWNKENSTVSTISIGFSNKVGGLLPTRNDQLLFQFDRAPSMIYNWRNNVLDTIPEMNNRNASPLSRRVGRTYIDAQGNEWFCTSEGIYITSASAFRSRNYLLNKDPDGLPYAIWSMAQQSNLLWLGTSKGLFLYDPLRKTFERNKLPEFDVDIRSMYKAGDTMLWISSHANLNGYDLRSRKIVHRLKLNSYPYFITGDKFGRIWVGTFYGGLAELDGHGKLIRLYDEKDGLAGKNLVSCLNEDGRALWIGMNGGRGFVRFDVSSKKVESFMINTGKHSLASSNTIYSIVREPSGNLWLGTCGGGVYYFDRSNNQFSNYRQSDGLSGDFVYSLALDKSGNLWTCGFNGIDKIDSKTKSIFSLKESMQFDNLDFINNLLVSKDGNFWFSSNGKLTQVDPEDYVESQKDMRILISSFRLFDKEINAVLPHSTQEFEYNQNFITVDFAALKQSPDIPIQYSYKLQGLHENWNYSGNRGVAKYTNIPPGNYTLLLNATNELGRWNNTPVSLIIIINPPFWKTWWFILLVISILAGSLYALVKYRLRLLRNQQNEQLRLVVATQEREKKNISAGLHDDLGVRLSALKYFVASLKNHLQPNDPVAQETYRKTMGTIDESVEDIRYLLINLSPKTLDEYGYLVAVEDLVNKLSRMHVIDISLVQQGLETRMPAHIETSLYRITQELINNTLKHAGATEVKLNIERTNGSIKLQYADNGKGFTVSESSNGYGIENIHTRVALLNGKIEWDMNGLSRVSIIIPYNHT